MKAIVFRAKDTVTKNIPKIIDPASVVNLQETVLSDKFQKEGAVIKLPAGAVGITGPKEEIKVLPCPHSYEDGCLIIDAIALKVNNLLRVIELFEAGEKKIETVNKSLQSLQDLVVTEISGKGGIICRDIIGHRAKHTGRGVLVPTNNICIEYVKLPAYLMAKLELFEGCLVIVGRDPVIWHGSIEVLRASSWEKKCIGLHPFLFEQMGADCDGDTVWVFKVPDTAACQEEAAKAMLGMTKKNVKSFKMEGTGKPEIAVNEDNFRLVAAAVGEYNGFSVGPEDIVNGSSSIEAFCENIKNVKEEARKISRGLSRTELVEYLTVINSTMLVQKVYLGPIGAAANKLKLIAGNNPAFLESAARLSEEMQQALFDYKGKVGSDTDSKLDVLEMLKVINMQGDFKTMPGRSVGHNKAIKALMKFGISDSCIPIVCYIYTIEPLLRALIELKGFKVLNENGTLEDIIGMGDPAVAVDSSKCLKIIEEAGKRNGLGLESLLAGLDARRNGNSLGKILSDPLYNIMNGLKKATLVDEIDKIRASISSKKVEITAISSFTNNILQEALRAD